MTLADDSTSELLTGDTQKLFESYNKLGTDDKLTLLYLLYEAMGDEITPAAPTAADPNLAPVLLGDFYSLPQDEQLAVMRQIVNGEDTEYSRAYGALTPNNQLLVWYAWAQGMGDTVVDMPSDYQTPQAINNVLNQIEQLEFQQQISILREVANQMGYSDVQPIPSQAETGKTASL
ncbi:orange carotenoid protein [Leptolyngbya sp. NK1-12]|uniref:Orange carotenoid protein n=1 Tax=Leptolyngbya sp. NK1-12 TaxID=2547451 RepID=A0AA96WC40_9CYAN|nr:orange carotenoid protein [Leptolyngbya sp. NK1-12]